MARKGSTLATQLVSVTRLTNSTNGNPRFRLNTTHGEYQTQSDAACSYDVDNIARKIRNRDTGESIPLPVTLSLTPAGRVWDIARREDDAPSTDGPTVANVKRHAGIAGQFSVSADVTYPGEPAVDRSGLSHVRRVYALSPCVVTLQGV